MHLHSHLREVTDRAGSHQQGYGEEDVRDGGRGSAACAGGAQSVGAVHQVLHARAGRGVGADAGPWGERQRWAWNAVMRRGAHADMAPGVMPPAGMPPDAPPSQFSRLRGAGVGVGLEQRRARAGAETAAQAAAGVRQGGEGGNSRSCPRDRGDLGGEGHRGSEGEGDGERGEGGGGSDGERRDQRRWVPVVYRSSALAHLSARAHTSLPLWHTSMPLWHTSMSLISLAYLPYLIP